MAAEVGESKCVHVVEGLQRVIQENERHRIFSSCPTNGQKVRECSHVHLRTREHDEGIGLDPADLTQVFRRGYRAASAGQIKGDGLGLYFAHGLITKHGGRMWAESPGRGRGSTFCFTLPLTQDGVGSGGQP